MGKWVYDRERINRLNAEIERLSREMVKAEDDFAILEDQEQVIAGMYTICDNTDYLTVCLDDKVDNIANLAKLVNIPGYNEVFDFSELKLSASMIQGLKKSNSIYMDELKSSGKHIDELQSIVAQNIIKLKDQISDLNIQLEEAERGKWVGD